MQETTTKFLKLTPEFKAKWVEALRSGTYRQGTTKLAQQNDEQITYCCLGVACAIEGIPLVALIDRAMPFTVHDYSKPLKVNEFLTKDPDSAEGDSHYILTRMNDEGKSFVEIATWIDENL